jgi:hypothetical protein
VRTYRNVPRDYLVSAKWSPVTLSSNASESEDKITFGVQYAWHDKSKPEKVFASKATARKVDGDWKIDGEDVRLASAAASRPDLSATDVGSAPIRRPAVWDPFNPPVHLIDPDLASLRGDIGLQPGRGCVNGMCPR